MTVASEQVAASALVGGGQTALHSHAGGGGANVKAGVVTGLADNASQAVTFGTAFATTPTVVACLASNVAKLDVVRVYDVTTTGFTMAIFKGHTGGGDTWDVAWLATEAGG